jgi:hypothetical protein
VRFLSLLLGELRAIFSISKDNEQDCVLEGNLEVQEIEVDSKSESTRFRIRKSSLFIVLLLLLALAGLAIGESCKNLDRYEQCYP